MTTRNPGGDGDDDGREPDLAPEQRPPTDNEVAWHRLDQHTERVEAALRTGGKVGIVGILAWAATRLTPYFAGEVTIFSVTMDAPLLAGGGVAAAGTLVWRVSVHYTSRAKNADGETVQDSTLDAEVRVEDPG